MVLQEQYHKPTNRANVKVRQVTINKPWYMLVINSKNKKQLSMGKVDLKVIKVNHPSAIVLAQDREWWKTQRYFATLDL